MPRVRRLLPLSAPLLLALLASGCGSSDSGSSTKAAPPPASPKQFPTAQGKTLSTLRGNLPDGVVLAPSTPTSIEVGDHNRLGFALFTTDRKQIQDAQVAVYTTDHDGTNVKGPYLAKWESLAVKPQYLSETTAKDPGAAKSVYVADVPVDTTGKRVFTGIARINGKLVQTSGFEIPIRRPRDPRNPIDINARAPFMHTETLSDVNGDASKLSTRVPPAKDLLEADYADALGKKPIVITFATPQLCQSRVCGPVVDVVEQVKAQTKGDVAFIHQEIYKDNDANKGYRPQLKPYRLASEPWTYVIDRHGKVSARFEGAVSVAELQAAVDRVASQT
jgi:hypothetical protein